MEWLTSPEIWIAFFTLTALEIVLGIDNIIFLSIMAAKLPLHQQARARTIGLAGAMGTRIALLVSLNWIAKLTTDLFTVAGMGFSGRDLILSLGGLFLFWKAGGDVITGFKSGDDLFDIEAGALRVELHESKFHARHAVLSGETFRAAWRIG